MRCPACGAHCRSGALTCANCGKLLAPARVQEQRLPSPRSSPAPAPALEDAAPLPTPPPVPFDAAVGALLATPAPLPPAPASSRPGGEPALATEPSLPAAGRSSRELSLSQSAETLGSSGSGERPAAREGFGPIPELARVAMRDHGPAVSAQEANEITLLHERRLFDQSRFEDLAGQQRPWAFHGAGGRRVGRAAELDLLHDAWRTVNATGRPVLVFVTGPPGIGKTRLLEDFGQQLERAGRPSTVLRLSAGEERADLRSALLAPLLRARFELGGLSTDQAAAKLRREVLAARPGSAGEELAGLLGHLLDLPAGGGVGRADPGGGERERRAGQALVRFLAEEARRAPILLVIDDLERLSGELLTALHGWICQLGEVPVLLAGLAPPELLARPLPWLAEGYRPAAGEPAVRRIALGPLTEAEVRRLLELFLGGSELPESLVALTTSRSGGNPLALEQLLELLVEHEVITRTAAGWKVDASRLAEGDIPVSLEGLVEARLRQLPAAELKLLRQAAVQGTAFLLGGLLACARSAAPAATDPFWFDEGFEESVREVLLGLQTRDIIRFRRSASSTGELQFEFRHAFEREWVYRSTPEPERQLCHRVFASWLEGHGGESARAPFEVVARHLEAGQALRRAAFAYLAAARQAAAVYRNAEAVFYLDRVVSFFGDDDAASRVPAFAELAQIHYNVGDYALSVNAGLRMLRDCYILGDRDRLAATYDLLGRALTDRGDFAAAERCLTRSLSLQEERQDKSGTARALDSLGQLYLKQGGSGSLDRAQRNFEGSLEIRRGLGDELGTALSYHLLGWVYTDRGFTREGRLCFREAIRLRSHAGDKDGLCRSLNNLAETYRLAGEAEKARKYYDEAYRVATEIGAQGLQAVILGNLAETDLLQGKGDEAGRRIDLALALTRALGDRPLLASHLITESKVRQLQGNATVARQKAEEALELLEQLQGTEDLGPALRRLGEVLARTLSLPGSADTSARARECFRRSIRVLSAAGNDLELARSMEAYAAFLTEQGSREKGQRYLQRAREILSRMKRPGP
ncbi:MAG: tetratricopeptide repeat protein [Myxococcota bacterium]|nr:tetratricopeptide repeat protein [Myxococcota bacterium]